MYKRIYIFDNESGYGKSGVLCVHIYIYIGWVIYYNVVCGKFVDGQ